MFEQEAPKWPWELFNDADSNTIHVGSQRGLSYDSNMIRKPPSRLGKYADQVGIDSYVLFGSDTTYVWTGSPQVIMARFRYDHKPDQRESRIQIWSTPYWLFSPPDKEDIYTFEDKKDRGPSLLLYIIYTLLKYIHLESRWLKYSKAEDGRYSTAGGSPPPTYVSLCALEHWWGSMTRCSDSCWP